MYLAEGIAQQSSLLPQCCKYLTWNKELVNTNLGQMATGLMEFGGKSIISKTWSMYSWEMKSYVWEKSTKTIPPLVLVSLW